MKKYLFGILAIAMAVGFSAFTTKNAHKPFTNTPYFYHPTSGKIFIGVTTPANPLSLVEGEVKNETYWTSTSMNFDATDNLAQIEFVEEFDEDGGNDGELTKQEAINALWSKYAIANTLPSNGGTFTVATGSGSTPAVVTVHRKSAL